MLARPWTIAAGILALMIAWAAALVWTRPESVAVTREIPAKTVSAWRVTRGDLHPVDRVTGLIVPARRSALHFQSGGPIVEKRVRPGQFVAEGELLLRIDDTLQTGDLAQAEARLANERKAVEWDRRLAGLARDQTRLLHREVRRQEGLHGESLTSDAALDRAKHAWLTQRAEQERLEHKVHTAAERLRILVAGRDQARHRLRQRFLSAPFAGIVNRVMVETGEQADPNRAALELVTPDQLELEIAVTGRSLPNLRLGLAVTVTVGEIDVTGAINALQPAPDASTHTHIVRIALPADERLAIGLPGQAHLPFPPLTGVPLVPPGAVWNEEGQHYVFRIDEASRLRRIPVDILAKTDEHIAVHPIRPGQYIVLHDVGSLSHGEAVHITEADGNELVTPASSR